MILAAVHSVIAPLTVGNDEWAHFLYIRFIHEHGRLPINLAERSNRDEVGYKADDPPLYHLITAAATAPIESTRLLRPINSPQRQLADNIVYPYAFIVHTGPELFPYRGEVLLWHLARIISIFFGVALIGLTYLTSLELGSTRRQALIPAAVLAFMPAILFHSSMVSYESLSAALAALFLLVGIKAIKPPHLWRWWLILGVLAGLSITTKYSAVLLPLEIVFMAWLAALRRRSSTLVWDKSLLKMFGQRLALAGLAILLASSWWFGFMVWHFNTIETKGWITGIMEPLIVRGAADSTAVSIAAYLFGEEDLSAAAPPPPLARNYPQLAQAMLDSFWAGPINGKYFLSPGLPLLFSLVALLGLIGLWRAWSRSDPTRRVWLILLAWHALLIVPLLVIRLFLAYDPREVVQGRHLLMPGASAMAILLSWGWQQWHYNKISRGFVAGLLLWSIPGQLGWAALTYSPPMTVWTKQTSPAMAVQVQPVTATLAKAMQLTGVSWQETPASSLEVNLWWHALGVMSEDYLVELTLLDSTGQVIGYVAGHPIQGRYPTRAWEPDDDIKDTYWLPLTGSLPGTYQLKLRLLNHQAQPLPEEQILSLGQVTLKRATSKNPDPCAVWYQGQPDYGHFLAKGYPIRSTLMVIQPDLPTLAPPVDKPGQAEQKPLLSVENRHIFVVGPDWVGHYQLWHGVTLCQDIWVNTPLRAFASPLIPQPLIANFNQEVQLLGYELPTRRIQPGQRLPLTLYWQALAYMGEDYHIFDNVLDREQRRWGGYDRRPRDGYSTLLWAPGEVITDAFGVPIDPAAPAGIYTLDIGLYRKTAAGPVSLPIIQAGQPAGSNSVRLGPIKVGGPPPEVVTNNPAPPVKLNQTLGNQITLLGYSLDRTSIDNCQLSIDKCQLSLTLYWRADVIPAADYTTFLHLRNAANQTVAQKDGPPAAGRYPTSLWDTGEIIVDEISLPLTGDIPPGRYTPVIGLYNFATNERLVTPGNPANEIDLEPVELP